MQVDCCWKQKNSKILKLWDTLWNILDLNFKNEVQTWRYSFEDVLVSFVLLPVSRKCWILTWESIQSCHQDTGPRKLRQILKKKILWEFDFGGCYICNQNGSALVSHLWMFFLTNQERWKNDLWGQTSSLQMQMTDIHDLLRAWYEIGVKSRLANS